MVFPVLMYRCESWTIKKTVPKNWGFQAVVLKKTLESPLDSKENKPVHPKGNQPWIFIHWKDWNWSSNTLATWCEEPTYFIKDRRRRGQQRMRWLNGITDSINMTLSKYRDIAKDRAAWHVAVRGVTKNQTWLSDWTTAKGDRIKNFTLFQRPSYLMIPILLCVCLVWVF